MSSNEPLYPNQPLVEVATEIRFHGNLEIEQIRAKFQKAICSNFPVLKVPNAQQGVAPSLQPFRFERLDGMCGVQLSINSFSYFTKNYPGNVSFLNELKSVLEAFFASIKSVKMTRVGWRYINSIPFFREEELIPLKHIFKNNDIFRDFLSGDLKKIQCYICKQFDDYHANIYLENRDQFPDSGEELVLDIDAFRDFEEPAVIAAEDAVNFIQGGHDVARLIFENLISDSYREFLKGGDDA